MRSEPSVLIRSWVLRQDVVPLGLVQMASQEGTQVLQDHLLLMPRAPHNVILWPQSTTFCYTDALIPDPLNLPLLSVPLAVPQGSLLSPLSWFGSSLGQGRCLVSCTGSWQYTQHIFFFGKKYLAHVLPCPIKLHPHWINSSPKERQHSRAAVCWAAVPAAKTSPVQKDVTSPPHSLKTTGPKFTLGIGRFRIQVAQNQSEGGHSHFEILLVFTRFLFLPH